MITLFENKQAYVKEAHFYENISPKHKPLFINGRSFYSLTYRYKGKISIKQGEKELMSFENCITYIPKNISYTTEILEDVHMTTVHFDIEGSAAPSEPAVIFSDSPIIRSLFLSLNPKNAPDRFSQMATLYKIFSELNKINSQIKKQTLPEKIKKANEIMEQSYCSPLFSVESIADELEISTAYLRREYRRAYGISPISRLKELRTAKAKQLLISQKLPLAEIARLSGYASTSYFIQSFKKASGETPSQYRKRLLLTP